MRLLKIARQSAAHDSIPLTVNDDGELEGLVFCLRCHSANEAGAEYCRACKHPLIEPPADLRDRLERISEHAEHREPEHIHDRVLEFVENFVDFLLSPVDAASSGLAKLSRRLGDPSQEFINRGANNLDSLLFARYLHVTIAVLIGMVIVCPSIALIAWVLLR